MVKIKVCGLKSSEEVLEATNLGVDFIGFVFAKSPRQVTPKQVSEITKKLPEKVAKVGVFVNERADIVTEIADYCSLDFVQLHGDERPEYCQVLKDKGLKGKIIKAFRIKDNQDFNEIDKFQVDAILADTYNKGLFGGSGMVFNWNLIKNKSFTEASPLILAGGLNSENVAKAIKILKPFAVDVSSGIETSGRKDFNKMKNFVAAVRRGNYVA